MSGDRNTHDGLFAVHAIDSSTVSLSIFGFFAPFRLLSASGQHTLSFEHKTAGDRGTCLGTRESSSSCRSRSLARIASRKLALNNSFFLRDSSTPPPSPSHARGFATTTTHACTCARVAHSELSEIQDTTQKTKMEDEDEERGNESERGGRESLRERFTRCVCAGRRERKAEDATD